MENLSMRYAVASLVEHVFFLSEDLFCFNRTLKVC